MDELDTKVISKSVSVDANCCNDHENSENASPLERNKERNHLITLYSFVLSFVTFLQWFLGILFFGSTDRTRGSSDLSSSEEHKRHKNPKMARVFVIDDASSCDKLLQSCLSQYPFRLNFLGIDCEWVSRKGLANTPVALLQIATPLCDCFLVRLCKMEGQMPQIVKEILEDKTILKFGVGIWDDVKRLSRMFGINVWGCVDLRHVAQRCQLENNAGQGSCQKMSLDALAKKILGVTMDKSWRIRCSNWEAGEFSKQQVEYAMNDALVASHIFLTLVKAKTKERNYTRTSCASEDFRPVEKNCIETEKCLDDGVACTEDENTKQFSSMANECDTDNNKTDSTLNLPGDNLECGNRMSDCCSTYRDLTNKEHVNSFQSECQENESLGQEGLNQRSISDDSANFNYERSSKEEDTFSDSKLCGKAFDHVVDTVGCYEYRADLNKFESDEIRGYLSRDEVINLFADSHFSQRAGSLCQGVVDLAFKQRKKKAVSSEKDNKEEGCSPEKSHRKPYKTGTARKSPLYMNCMLAAPDGSRLCTLDRRKADWYIDRGIGYLTCLNPYTVQLNFEPAGRPGTEDYYYLNFKDNVCVVCGSNQSYMRKNIVPHDYRRHFPLVMKDHHSHDILLMCPECHCLSNSYDDRLRKELAIKYDAPLGNAAVARLVEDPVLRKVKSAAKALSYAGNNIPEDRRQELSVIVQKHFNSPVVSSEMIMHAVTMETRKENANFVSHGLQVVRRVREEGKLLEFEKMWRKHFIDTMCPRYLPPLWSVDHRHKGLKEKLGDCNEFN